MPACGDGLQDEAWLLEELRLFAFPDFIGGEAVAVGGEGLRDGREGVGCIQPGGGVEVCFDAGDLLVEGFGDEEIDAVS